MREELKSIKFNDVRDTNLLQFFYTESENCKVVDNPRIKSDIYILFISSNSVYFPNTDETVKTYLGVKDKYEWVNIAQMEPLRSEVSRFIFIRDIYKQWYISGINNTVDGIDKCIDYLKNLIDGYRLVIVGNSSGGYLSALLSTKLQAERAFSISGQWDISDQQGSVC